MAPFGLELPPQLLALALVCFASGLAVPFAFAMERLRGFGRFMFAKLPYRPPDPPDETIADAQEAGKQ